MFAVLNIQSADVGGRIVALYGGYKARIAPVAVVGEQLRHREELETTNAYEAKRMDLADDLED